jgi:hypothetical protein
MFTINNPENIDLVPILESHQIVRYCVWQLERGETRQTLHIQGYVELTRPQRRSAISRLFPTAWIEPRRGSKDQAREYCRKEDSRIEGPWEYGEWINSQGSRTDLETLHQWLQQGKSEEDICTLNFKIWKSNINVIRNYKSLNTPHRTDYPELHILTGSPGCGKSRTAENTALDSTYYSKEPGKWWDNYCNQQIVIMEDFKGDISLTEMLQLCGKAKKQVQIKGGFVTFNSNQIILTSNVEMKDWYPSETQIRLKALERRVSTRHVFENVGENVIRVTSKKYNLHHPQHPVIQESQIFLPLQDVVNHLTLTSLNDENNHYPRQLSDCNEFVTASPPPLQNSPQTNSNSVTPRRSKRIRSQSKCRS